MLLLSGKQIAIVEVLRVEPAAIIKSAPIF